MQLRLELAESPAPAVALWELVGEEQRQAAMVLLAALIARTVVGERDERRRRSVSERSKLTASHLRRQAFVYVRQSSQAQVERNVESTARQYALVERRDRARVRARAGPS